MTRVLVCGANGVIGKAISNRLRLTGATVIKGVRHAHAADETSIDFRRDTSVASWLPRLGNIDVVVNAVGIIVERPGQRFEDAHQRAAQALFEACQRAGVRRVLQISALGAGTGDTPYFKSKRAADEFLMSLRLPWQIVRPALVYATEGASARMFRMLASLPVVALPGGGRQALQPVHIDDLLDIVQKLIDPATPARQCVDVVGRDPVTYRQMLRSYRASMEFPPALEVPIPASVMTFLAHLAGAIPGSVLTPDTWKMLQAGNTADPAATADLLGHPARGLAQFIEPADVPALRQTALARWRAPLLRASLATVWILTGLLSLFAFPIGESLAMLARLGLSGGAASSALYAGAVLDLVLGIASVIRPGRRLWVLQIVVIIGYTALIAYGLPEFIAHPFGPVLKNLPILALLFVLLAEETKP